ncbi:MAG: alpha/beta hydrolase [bacterium]|nr:alpha/beta hydrolase [bacterium]
MIEVILRRATEPRSKTPLLFVHGAWHGAWCWEHGFLDFFSERGWNSYALSLRNHGESLDQGSLRWIRHGRFVDDIASVVNDFERPPVLIGHSMGGYLVQKYMEDNDVAGAVLMGSVPVSGTLNASMRFARRHPLQFTKLLLAMSLWPVVASPRLAREYLFGADASDEDVVELHEMLQDESFLTYLDMMGMALPKPGKTDAPVMVCAGSEDALFTVREAHKTAEAYGVAAHIFNGLPHDMMLHPRWQEPARAIARWLEDVT